MLPQIPWLQDASHGVEVYALIVSIIGAAFSTKRLTRLWQTRHLRRVWGIKDGAEVLIVCSELDEGEQRQRVEPREFIYSLKYGDVDALFEVVITLLRLFPNLKLRVISAGELESTRLDLTRNLVIIGGPDYNALTERIIAKGAARMRYRGPDSETALGTTLQEIIIIDSVRSEEFYCSDDTRDFGYFERIPNPHNPHAVVILLGGCHTIGVTGAVKAFSLADSESGMILAPVLNNARSVANAIKKRDPFTVIVSAERVGQTVSTPLVMETNVRVGRAS